jgi:uncharacterized coiled-coil protein SlyX
MLLNEFLKEHRTVQEQQAMIGELKSSVAKQEATSAQQTDQFRATIAQQQKQIEALTAGLQKVSTRLELNKPAPQLVTDDR